MNHRCYICYKGDLPDDQHYHEKCSKKVFGTAQPPVVSYSLEDIKELAKNIIQSHHGVTGVQPKISVGIDRTMDRRGRITLVTGDYILKPPSVDYPQMPENEDLTMRLAELMNLKTVPHALIPLSDGELAYITRRIDRSAKGKYHMEDFCQLAGLLTEDKYRSSMERLGKLIRQYSTFPVLDLLTVFELTLFCFLTGNNDMHLKNFSLIDQGAYNLSPAYDLLNVNILLPSDKEEAALPVNGKKANLKRNDFEMLAQNYGIDKEQSLKVFETIQTRLPELIASIKSSFLNEENKKKYTELVTERAERLEII